MRIELFASLHSFLVFLLPLEAFPDTGVAVLPPSGFYLCEYSGAACSGDWVHFRMRGASCCCMCERTNGGNPSSDPLVFTHERGLPGLSLLLDMFWCSIHTSSMGKDQSINIKTQSHSLRVQVWFLYTERFSYLFYSFFS